MKPIIYADNAATTKLDIDAFKAMKPFLLEEYGNASQPYSFARAGKKALKQARIIIAECIGALPEEIYFTSGGTESDNWAIKGTALISRDLRATITSAVEHHAILNACSTVKRLGFPVAYMPVDREGIVRPNILRKFITDNTKLISVMMANNEIGTIQPIQELCTIAHEHGALFHTDAVQAMGHIPIDVRALNVDMLSASAHKFNGPKGVGFLYVRSGVQLYSIMDGGGQENYHRAGTENIAGIVGMAVALKVNQAAISTNASYLQMLCERFKSGISTANLDCIYNGSTNRLPGHISVAFKGIRGEMLLHRLDLMGIEVSTGSACNSKETELSHVLQAIHAPEEYVKGTIRITLGKDNTISDVDRIVDALAKIIHKQ